MAIFELFSIPTFALFHCGQVIFILKQFDGVFFDQNKENLMFRTFCSHLRGSGITKRPFQSYDVIGCFDHVTGLRPNDVAALKRTFGGSHNNNGG